MPTTYYLEFLFWFNMENNYVDKHETKYQTGISLAWNANNMSSNYKTGWFHTMIDRAVACLREARQIMIRLV